MRDTENKIIKNIEDKYLFHKRHSVYIMLEDEDINWYWDESDIIEFDKMFNEGIHFLEIAKHFGRPAFEVVLLTIDRDLKGVLNVGNLTN